MTAINKRHKIFVSAYACEPNQGSEIGVGWHWVLEMSKYFDLWVMTRESNRESIERWLAENNVDHLPIFLYYDIPQKWRFWKRGLRGVRVYYIIWQHLTNGIVRECMKRNGVEIYHLLTYGNALWPASRYGQKQHFIWGPTSAGSYLKTDFTSHYGVKSRVKEFVQRIMARSLRFNRGFQARCRDAKVIICKTEQMMGSISSKYRHKATLFTDVAIELIDTTNFKHRAEDGIIRYLAVGRLEAWRGFDLLIEAFSLVLKRSPQLHLDILGQGTDRERLERIIERLKVKDSVFLRGQVSMEEYYQYMADCDVVVNPTLKEGAVTTAFDSMSFAKPLICVKTGGYTHYFDSEYSILINPKCRSQMVQDLCEALLALTIKERRLEMSRRIIAIRENFTWERKGEQIRDLILTALDE